MVNLQDVFLIILSLFANLKLMSVFYSWIIFSLQVGDIWSLYGGQAHYDYDYCYNLSYVIFDQQLKITFRKSSGPPEKVHPPLFTHSPRKIQKVQVPPFLPTLKIFQPPPLQKGGGGGHLWLYHIQNPRHHQKSVEHGWWSCIFRDLA